MSVGEGHLKRVQRKVDVSSVLVTARTGHSLHHLHGVFSHLSCGAFLASPVCVGELRNDVAPLFQSI